MVTLSLDSTVMFGPTALALTRLPAADPQDSYTAAHSRRVRRFALAIGGELGLAAGELGPLGHAALFHDIGKLAVPAEILLKPARLDANEWALMRRHSVDGAEMAGSLGLCGRAVPAIRHHHERYDGEGYPDGLAGEAIPLAARIIHVADALDSMLTTRPYRAGRPARATLTELRGGAGTQFCPRCVAALERLVGDGSLVDMGLSPASLIAPVP